MHVRLVEPATVDVDDAIARLDRFAWKADHALDEVTHVGVLLLRRALEHHDIAAMHGVHVVAELVDEDAVAHLQRRRHRLRGDVERLEDGGLDDQRHHERADHDQRPLDGRPE